MVVNVASMLERIPSMDDKELVTFQTNVGKFKDAGTATQRNAAFELIPAIEAELEKRRAEKAAKAAAKKPAKKKTTKAE